MIDSLYELLKKRADLYFKSKEYEKWAKENLLTGNGAKQPKPLGRIIYK